MKAPISLTSAARAFAAVVGAGELLGHFYFGTFTVTRTFLGAAALLLACLKPAANARAVLALATVAFALVLGAAYDYYERLAVPGNNFAWPVRAPFLFALAFLGWRAVQAMSSQRPGHEG